MKILSIVLCIALLFSSCKEDTSKPTQLNSKQNIPKELLQDSVFRVFIDGNIKATDTFSLHYTLDSKIQPPVFYSLKGSDKQQRITFELPKEKIPSHFSIHLGKNKKNTESTVNRIILNYNKDRIVIKDSSLYVYFGNSEGLKFLNNRYVIQENQNDSLTLATNSSLSNRIYNRYINQD